MSMPMRSLCSRQSRADASSRRVQGILGDHFEPHRIRFASRMAKERKEDPLMKKKLTMRETIIVASTLFGMFFGAGNLIFPVHLGQMAGSNAWPAIVGFVITAVGIPILAVAAIGNTHSDDLLQLSSKVSGWYGKLFTAVLYLTIGPFFAIPRCATVSFTTGIAPMISESSF